MTRSLQIVICNPARTIFALTPKCGSTSIVNVFLKLAGFEPREWNSRSFASRAQQDGRLEKAGLSFENMTLEKIADFQMSHPDYALFATIRDPYARVVSNYFNKLNRYAKRRNRLAHSYGKLRQLFEGRKSWPHVETGILHMQKLISFETFLAGLQEYGTDFDSHFALQSKLLGLERMDYDRLFRLETLSHEFPPALLNRGLPDDMTERLGTLPQKNATNYTGNQDRLMTEVNRRTISHIYAKDFDLLDYPR